MRSCRVAALAAALTTLAVAVPASAGAASFRLDRTERAVVSKLNTVRASVGVRPLRRGHRFARAADAVVGAWMASPSHRATLLSPRFRRIGVARRAGPRGASAATAFPVDVASAR